MSRCVVIIGSVPCCFRSDTRRLQVVQLALDSDTQAAEWENVLPIRIKGGLPEALQSLLILQSVASFTYVGVLAASDSCAVFASALASALGLPHTPMSIIHSRRLPPTSSTAICTSLDAFNSLISQPAWQLPVLLETMPTSGRPGQTMYVCRTAQQGEGLIRQQLGWAAALTMDALTRRSQGDSEEKAAKEPEGERKGDDSRGGDDGKGEPESGVKKSAFLPPPSAVFLSRLADDAQPRSAIHEEYEVRLLSVGPSTQLLGLWRVEYGESTTTGQLHECRRWTYFDGGKLGVSGQASSAGEGAASEAPWPSLLAFLTEWVSRDGWRVVGAYRCRIRGSCDEGWQMHSVRFWDVCGAVDEGKVEGEDNQQLETFEERVVAAVVWSACSEQDGTDATTAFDLPGIPLSQWQGAFRSEPSVTVLLYGWRYCAGPSRVKAIRGLDEVAPLGSVDSLVQVGDVIDASTLCVRVVMGGGMVKVAADVERMVKVKCVAAPQQVPLL
ncbi:unnamed protein product [Vitrella brassicaformis CCMP3155]|uniref:Uncharacterized protein n=2 Tax=Vitrella brassicaformis TaxID=1169539 RepID=A0A0G4EMA7_VITBC|nr:unnamed protein product [Vitrella brassicaformis CCMP3155]|eukprot:CEL98120.1 unnamed protein product [Vitrella brassicaformis CCMP3155]